jgi:iron complex outermembrane receptor protein
LGHRATVHQSLTFDAVGFVHDYDNLLSSETYGLGNQIFGQTYGAEFNSRYQATTWWRLESSLSVLRLEMRAEEGSLSAPAVQTLEGYDPKNVASLQSRINVTSYLELDGAIRYVDNITTFDIPSYFVADVRIGWRPSDHVEISLAARDLFDPHHPEQIRTNATEVEQSVFAKITWELP